MFVGLFGGDAAAGRSFYKTQTQKIRFVNVLELTALGIGADDCRVPLHDFEDYFTADKPVLFNFYGYPEAIEPMLLEQKNPSRFRVFGYIENGSTTTSFDMQVRNKTDRFHIAMEALKLMAKRRVVKKEKSGRLIRSFQKKLTDHRKYIQEYGVDPDEIENWKWPNYTS